MKALLILVIILWIIIIALIILFSKKYNLVNAKCVNGNVCKNFSKKDGFVYFEYEKDFGRGINTYYGQATTVGNFKEGKKCKLLITREYNERVLIFSDFAKLIVVMVILSLLLLVLYVLEIDILMFF